MQLIRFIPLPVLLLFTFVLSAQQELPSGYFTSEACAINWNNKILLSIKKYNPSREEVENAAHYNPKKPMNYLMAPFQATEISLHDRGFESLLYCLQEDGKISWSRTNGFSKTSAPVLFATDAQYVYTGGEQKDKPTVDICKLDANGKEQWKIAVDSLENIHALAVDSSRLTALVSFDSYRENKKGNEVSYTVFPVYSLLTFDKNTGQLLSKEYQPMGTYLSGNGFKKPLLADSRAYYLAKEDSLLFLNAKEQTGAKVLNDNFEKSKPLVGFTAAPGRYEFISTGTEKGKAVHYLCSDNFIIGKKFQALLPEPVNESNRVFIRFVPFARIICFGNNKGVTAYKVTDEGQVKKILETKEISSPLLSFSASGNRLFLYLAPERLSPGKKGTIQVKQFPY